jgi:hypothetical protein
MRHIRKISERQIQRTLKSHYLQLEALVGKKADVNKLVDSESALAVFDLKLREKNR